MRIGLIRERKNPPDHRVVLSPQACKELKENFPEAEIIVEPSPIRVYSDEEYREAGIEVADRMEDCEVLIGVKEVPIEALIPGKKYFFFSHTIKKQPYNRELLLAVLEKSIELYDHEVITDQKGNRLVAFGRYAGIVGAYNGVRALGLKTTAFDLPKAESLKDRLALLEQLNSLTLGPVKILITGHGRVGMGAREMIEGMGIRQVGVKEYLEGTFAEPVYCQLDSLDYNKRKDGQKLPVQDFYANPEEYESDFMKFAKVTDLFIAGHFYAQGAPYLYTREDVRHPDFRICTVADISCDIDGPVATTLQPSTIADPIYGYDPINEYVVDYHDANAIAVMAVDNLPAELPRDASDGFGEAFLKHVIPALFSGDPEGVLERARMTRNKQLTSAFAYLEKYVVGEE